MSPAAQVRGDAPRQLRPTGPALSDSLLADDAMFRRVAPAARSALVDAALSEGRACAESVSFDWGTDPWTIARRLGVVVVESDADASFGSVVVFAEYAEKPPTIMLYRMAIDWANRQLTASRERDAPNLGDCSPMFLAHELYHHLARSAPTEPFSRAYRVTLLQFGRWRWTSRIASLEEIAAGAFAQSLLGMKVHPRLIEPLWVRQKHGGEQ
jgi:hypothetical protein